MTQKRLLRAVAVSSLTVATVLAVEARRPPDVLLHEFLATRLQFKPVHLAALGRGEPAAVLLPPTVDREVAVGGAIHVKVPAERLAALLQDVERLEAGEGFLKTKRISDPPRLEDFAALEVPAADIAALRSCRPGRCDVKLGQGAFDLLKQVDWRAPGTTARVNDLARQTALEYVNAYRRDGNAALAIYLDSDRPQFIAAEFGEMIRRTSLLSETLPTLADYLIHYPDGPRPPDTSEFFYWSLADFGLKPVVRLNHVVAIATGRPSGTRYAVAVKQLYASHYFHTALEVRAVIADEARPAEASYLVVLNMARSDGLTGMFGGIVKSKVRSRSRSGLEKALAAIKRIAESGR